MVHPKKDLVEAPAHPTHQTAKIPKVVLEDLIADETRASGAWPTFNDEDVPRDRETMPAPPDYGAEPPPTLPSPVLQALLDELRDP